MRTKETSDAGAAPTVSGRILAQDGIIECVASPIMTAGRALAAPVPISDPASVFGCMLNRETANRIRDTAGREYAGVG